MFIQSIVGRHLHSLQFLTVVNKAAVTSCLQNSVAICFILFFWQIPRIRISWLYSRGMF